MAKPTPDFLIPKRVFDRFTPALRDEVFAHAETVGDDAITIAAGNYESALRRLRCNKCRGPHPTSTCMIPDGMTPAIARAEAQAGGCCDPPME